MMEFDVQAPVGTNSTITVMWEDDSWPEFSGPLTVYVDGAAIGEVTVKAPALFQIPSGAHEVWLSTPSKLGIFTMASAPFALALSPNRNCNVRFITKVNRIPAVFVFALLSTFITNPFAHFIANQLAPSDRLNIIYEIISFIFLLITFVCTLKYMALRNSVLIRGVDYETASLA